MKKDSSDQIVLAIDCATTGTSVCVWRDGRALSVQSQNIARGQAEVLLQLVKDALDDANLEASDLTKVAVTRGPGAFTGLRIALSTARGFAMALGIECVGVTTLAVLAHGVDVSEARDKSILACIESKREDIYVQVFSQDLMPLSEPLAVVDAALVAILPKGDLVLVGDASARAKDMILGLQPGASLTLSTASSLPDPAMLARLSVVEQPDNPVHSAPDPLYLRPPDAALPKNPGRPTS